MATRRAEARWRTVVRAQEASGQSVREFADEHGLSAATIYWWRSALGRGGRARRSLRLAPVAVAGARTRLLEHGDRIEVCLVNGRRVSLPADLDIEHVRRLVEALERC